MKAFKKDVEKHHKQHLQHFKELGKEVAQSREACKDVLLLRKDMDKQLKTSQKLSKETKDLNSEVARVANTMEKQQKSITSASEDIKKMQNKVTSLHNNTDEVKKLQNKVAALQKTVAEQDRIIQRLQKPEEAQKMKEDILALQQAVEKQKDTMLTLQKIKDDFAGTSRKTVKEMNGLIQAQGQQVEEFRAIRENVQHDLQKHEDQIEGLQAFKTELKEDTQKQIHQASPDFSYESLKDKAFNGRNNIVIIGLPEQNSRSVYSVVGNFFKNDLKLNRVEIREAYRLGQPPKEGSTHIRPLMVKFWRTMDRNLIWKKRNSIPQTDGSPRIKIQADLPKQLRDDLFILYKVADAASSMEEYQNAVVRDYALILNGESYTAKQLELLPIPLRLSSLAVKISEEAIAFFSRHSILSNHFPSTFQLQDKTFHSME